MRESNWNGKEKGIGARELVVMKCWVGDKKVAAAICLLGEYSKNRDKAIIHAKVR